MGETCEKITLSVFDFDGTCIKGSSSVKLVQKLTNEFQLSFVKIVRLIKWGLCYKTNKNRDDERAREIVFSAFSGKPVDEVEDYFIGFYARKIKKRIRDLARIEIAKRKEAGDIVVLLSANFELLLRPAQQDLQCDYCVGTVIATIGDVFSNTIVGETPEGIKKLHVLTDFADKTFGEGCWQIDWAYGNHFSDRFVLSEARNPVAVEPDKKLADFARQNGWKIAEW